MTSCHKPLQLHPTTATVFPPASVHTARALSLKHLTRRVLTFSSRGGIQRVSVLQEHWTLWLRFPVEEKMFRIQGKCIKKKERHRTSSPDLLWSTGQLGSGRIEREGCEGTVVSLDQRQSALKESDDKVYWLLMEFPRHVIRACGEWNAGSPNHWHHRGWFLRSWHCQGTPGRSYCGWRTERRDLQDSAEDQVHSHLQQ